MRLEADVVVIMACCHAKAQSLQNCHPLKSEIILNLTKCQIGTPSFKSKNDQLFVTFVFFQLSAISVFLRVRTYDVAV